MLVYVSSGERREKKQKKQQRRKRRHFALANSSSDKRNVKWKKKSRFNIWHFPPSPISILTSIKLTI